MSCVERFNLRIRNLTVVIVIAVLGALLGWIVVRAVGPDAAASDGSAVDSYHLTVVTINYPYVNAAGVSDDKRAGIVYEARWAGGLPVITRGERIAPLPLLMETGR
jgi:hypothetical protein